MAMSDCVHCLSTPCECGSEYKDWNIERLIQFRNIIQTIIDIKIRNDTTKLNKYRIGLRVGGLMEDPMYRHEYINIIEADSLNSAIDIWAEITGENKKSTWNKDNRTVWGWNVVDVDDDMKYINKHNDHVRSNM